MRDHLLDTAQKQTAANARPSTRPDASPLPLCRPPGQLTRASVADIRGVARVGRKWIVRDTSVTVRVRLVLNRTMS